MKRLCIICAIVNALSVLKTVNITSSSQHPFKGEPPGTEEKFNKKLQNITHYDNQM